MQDKMNSLDQAVNICFIAPKAYPLFNPDIKSVFGGSEVDLYFLATELAKDKRFKVSFITADYGQNITEIIDNVKIIKSLMLRQNALSGAVKLWQAMNKADAQIYMIKSVSMGVPLVALFCHLNEKIFLCRTSHTNHCDGTYLKKHPVKGQFFKRALRQASLVFVQNRTDCKDLRRTVGVNPTVIPNGHHIGRIIETKRNTILWAGRSAAFKRPELFTRLAKEVPTEQFTMICQEATDDKNYSKLVASARRAENLEFIERVPFDKINEYFLRAKVFVNTSESEGFANTFIQACKAGTPILSMNVNPDNFLDDYHCGICCSNDWNKFVDSLNFLLQDRRYIDFGKNGRKYAEEKHDIEKIAGQYKKLFIELVQNKTQDM